MGGPGAAQTARDLVSTWMRGTNMRQPKPCAISGCDRLTNVPGTAKGLCHSHYRRLKVYGDPLGAPPPRPKSCIVDGCEGSILARGWCSMHWNRWYKTGTTADPVNGHPLLKHCGSCDNVYPRNAENFHRHKGTSDGLDAYCKPCARERRKRYLEANRGRINVARRDAYWADPEMQRAIRREWVAANPERAKDISSEAFHRRRAAMASVDAERFAPSEIFDRDGWRCGICDRRISKDLRYPDPLSVSLDHIVPLARGGDHTRANTQAAHLRCNLRKHCGGTDQLKLLG